MKIINTKEFIANDNKTVKIVCCALFLLNK